MSKNIKTNEFRLEMLETREVPAVAFLGFGASLEAVRVAEFKLENKDAGEGFKLQNMTVGNVSLNQATETPVTGITILGAEYLNIGMDDVVALEMWNVGPDGSDWILPDGSGEKFIEKDHHVDLLDVALSEEVVGEYGTKAIQFHNDPGGVTMVGEGDNAQTFTNEFRTQPAEKVDFTKFGR